jgi:hypothetical protein
MFISVNPLVGGRAQKPTCIYYVIIRQLNEGYRDRSRLKRKFFKVRFRARFRKQYYVCTRDRCYDFLNIFAEKLAFLTENEANKKRHFFRRKLSKIAEKLRS